MHREDICLIFEENLLQNSEQILSLKKLLCEMRLSHSCIDPKENLISVVQQRTPRVVVCDFLLSNFGTALELLEGLQSPDKPKIIILTDEPSLSSAVECLKLGAADYIEIHTPKSELKVIQEIKSIIKNKISTNNKQTTNSCGHPIFASPVINRTKRELTSHSSCLTSPLIILHGPSGCGKSFLSEYFHCRKKYSGVFKAYDIDTTIYSPSSIFEKSNTNSIFSCKGSTVFIDHVESDIIHLLNEYLKFDVAEQSTHNSSLVIGTTSKETAETWARTTNSPIVSIPSLNNRKDCFLPLVLQFQRQAKNIFKTEPQKPLTISINILKKLDWPGNLTQLKAVIFNSIGTTKALYEQEAQDILEKDFSQEIKKLNNLELSRLICLLSAKLQWEKSQITTFNNISKRKAAVNYLKYQGDLRITAASLGTSIPKLQKLLLEDTIEINETNHG